MNTKPSTFLLPKHEKANLLNDKRQGVGRLLLTISIAIMAIDLGVVTFYIKTRDRFTKMEYHPYTQDIASSVSESTANHHDFSKSTHDTIKKHQDELKNHLDNLEAQIGKLNNVQVQPIEGVEELEQTLISAISDDKDNDALWSSAAFAHNRVAESVAELDKGLAPLRDFSAYSIMLGESFRTVTREMRTNHERFLNKLLVQTDMKSESQRNVFNRMQDTLQQFNSVYSAMIKSDGTPVRLNNFYAATPIVYDKNYVHLDIDYKEAEVGAKLTTLSEFTLRIPRVYFCNVKAHISSDKEFNISLEYVDALTERVLFKSGVIAGNPKIPKSHDEQFMFNLHENEYALYLRVVSASVQKVFIENLKLNCLSYRNFVK